MNNSYNQEWFDDLNDGLRQSFNELLIKNLKNDYRNERLRKIKTDLP